jgi:DNA-directed RNA polymerase subunit RPC12/RpoP
MDSIREALSGGSTDVQYRYQCGDCDEVFTSTEQSGVNCPACGEERAVYRL